MEKEGFTINRGKHLALKGADQKSFLRIDSLGVGYREADLEKVFAGEEAFDSHVRKEQNQKTRREEKKFDMLLDIQDVIAKGKGPGYERWAKVHNIKQISQILLFLRDAGIRDMDELVKNAGDSSERFSELSQTIKDSEKRLEEIAVLKTHIINYSKTNVLQ